MKKTLFIVCAILISMASCGNKKSDNTAIVEEEYIYELDSLLKVADKNIDSVVKVKGFVTHTCAHSGKRCFIAGEEGGTTFRVEAKGSITSFDKELIGSEIEIEGIVKEHRLTQEEIDEQEKKTNDKKAKDEAAAESCQAELDNIKEMRDWMVANNKDYYAIYYMDGINYEVIGQ